MEHKPFILPQDRIAEFTPTPLLVGIILGIVFGASSLYLALKVGMTVSASIPIAVLSITLFKLFTNLFGLRKATILENNIVQTTGSAGESLAFGVAVTMPALLMLGFEMELSRIIVVAVLGGLLGILMMIPLRWVHVVKEHGKLAYPEGTACAAVLIAGEKGGTSAKTVFGGFFFGLAYKFLNLGLRLWNDVPAKAITWFKGAQITAEVSPELLGVGYIIGPRVACYMVGGGILSSWCLIPMIQLFGDGLLTPLFPATKLIREMAIHEIWRSYVLYIGAGAVATGGIISMVRSFPSIVHGARAGLGGLKSRGDKTETVLRTEKDIPMPFVIFGSLLLVVAIWMIPSLHMNLLGAVLIVVFGFLFSTVSSRLTGEIGSSSNPISGMTVATLLLTSLIFLTLGWVTPEYRIAALSVAAVVCVAASNAGTTSQDLKTGFLVGGTPRSQQLSLLVGALTAALVIGYTLNLLNEASTIYSRKSVPLGVVVPNVDRLTAREQVKGYEYSSDTTSYLVFRLAETPKEGPLAKVPPGKYLVDDAGKIHYFVDPGINGSLPTRDDGTTVQKYDAPKARLMSLIIDGILTQKLPWGMVLLGATISIVLELCGVSSLPFAVGVYLPLSTSMPIFWGGFIRWIVGRVRQRRFALRNSNSEETESAPGILFSSGLIAGGAICGIALALLSVKSNWGSALDLGSRVGALATTSNWTPVLVFSLMMLVLYFTGVGRKSVD